MKGIALRLDTDVDLQMSGDPLLLAQALSNLVENALKYAPDNGSIAIRALHTASGVGVTVADNGPGIPDAEKPKVTDRFYRGDASRGTPGVGLGLSLVSAVARLHGGTLELADNLPGLRATLHLGPAMAVISQPPVAVVKAPTTPAVRG
jgi:signal transduction histidine kinase